jgi:uncharacterized small protein (DUF1192 family)
MTAEEYLRQDVGALVASLLFQIAMLRAEIDRLKTPDHAEPVPNGATR